MLNGVANDVEACIGPPAPLGQPEALGLPLSCPPSMHSTHERLGLPMQSANSNRSSGSAHRDGHVTTAAPPFPAAAVTFPRSTPFESASPTTLWTATAPAVRDRELVI